MASSSAVEEAKPKFSLCQQKFEIPTEQNETVHYYNYGQNMYGKQLTFNSGTDICSNSGDNRAITFFGQ